VVRGTFSPARAWRPAVGARLARTLGRTSARPCMLTASSPLGISDVRHTPRRCSLRDAPCVCRARHGAGAQRRVQAQSPAAPLHPAPVRSTPNERASLPASANESGQFNEPRPKRNAFKASAVPPPAPRSVVLHGKYSAHSALVPYRLRSSVRPNTSLNRTRYGKHRKPGPRHMVHHLVPGLRCSPPRAG
jgi:hypothetical protein